MEHCTPKCCNPEHMQEVQPNVHDFGKVRRQLQVGQDSKKYGGNNYGIKGKLITN